jgi:four helix bundle protein
MNYSEWEQKVPEAIRRDSVWNAKAYRFALFLSDVAWQDVTRLMQDKRTIGLSDQLYRSVGAISADVEEGYSRGTGRDRSRFYGYALGSAREARGWYYKGRHILREQVIHHRIELLTEIIKLLLTMIPDQRGETLREVAPPYQIRSNFSESEKLTFDADMLTLLNNIPMP